MQANAAAVAAAAVTNGPTPQANAGSRLSVRRTTGLRSALGFHRDYASQTGTQIGVELLPAAFRERGVSSDSSEISSGCVVQECLDGDEWSAPRPTRL